MSPRKTVVGIGLVALGAAAALSTTHLHVTWGPSAHASPVVIAEAKPALPPPTAAQVNDARSLSRTFAQVAAQLSPSVVRISITKTVKGGRFHHGGNPFSGTPFERFFGEGDGDEDGGMDQGQKQHGTGSGVVIDKKGYILTNNHVVEDADEVKVSFGDGKTVTGKVVGTDPKSDLAVVKVDGVDVQAARLGDSDKVAVGEWVIAIGNPFGLDHTVTVGVLSAKNRSGLGSGPFEDFLQTDASINPGNSGGPLVDLDGEVIGINTMIAGIGTGIGFAVPSSMAKPITDQLIKNGKVHRPFLGVVMQELTPELSNLLSKRIGHNAPEKGAVVTQVAPGSPADKAGIKPEDVIVSIDKSPMTGSKSVQRTVLGKQIGQRVNVDVWRDGKSLTMQAALQELPGDERQASRGEGGASPKAKLGLSLQSLTPDLSERLGVGKGLRGAVVTGVRDGSPAQDAGLKQGDVIIEVDRRPVGGSDEAVKLLQQDQPGGHLLRVKRQDGALFIVIPSV
jgi:serine protease Do